jgi:predicted ester cyclase
MPRSEEARVSSTGGHVPAVQRHVHAHRFDKLEHFVARDVEVNGEVRGLRTYVAGLEGVVRAFPDYRWDV